jgi:polyhydroxyalkanoate synthesis repressor PhaR
MSHVQDAIIIKKYANRRLYNTETSSYVTLDDLAVMVKAGRDFVVHDAKTGEDLTKPVLTQLIVELESNGENLLPITFLRQLISFYGDSLQGILPRYLETAMGSFTNNQHKIREYLQGTLNAWLPYTTLEEWQRQQRSFVDHAFRFFMPQHSIFGVQDQQKVHTIEALEQKVKDLEEQLAMLNQK